MSEREQNLFLICALLLVLGFCYLMYLGHKDYEEKILSVQATCYYKVYKDKSVLASLHLPVEMDHPDRYGPRLRKEFRSEQELFGVPLNSMWGHYDYETYSRVKYKEFGSYAELVKELNKVSFQILIYKEENDD